MTDAGSNRRRLRAGVIIDLVRQGWRPPTPKDEQTACVVDDMGRLTHAQTLALTANELDVLARVAHGDTAQQIADQTGRSRETIKTTMNLVRAKLGARNAPHAVALALSQDLIGPVE